eukprot:gene4797-6724_t
MRSNGEFRMRGLVDIKKESSYVKNLYKRKDIVIHPTLISYSKGDSTTPQQNITDPTREIDMKRDFLLAPLGRTVIIQEGETILVLVSNSTKIKMPRTNEIKSVKPIIQQQLTLKFSTRNERDIWMNCIIEECERNYLRNLVDDRLVEGKFFKSTNKEIWSRILLGDETLRKAYIAQIGSDHIRLIRAIAKVVIDWLQILLRTDVLNHQHKEIFTSLFSLLIDDSAARAIFFLFIPNSDFFDELKAANYSAVSAVDKKKGDRAEHISISVIKNFIIEVKASILADEWKEYRVFLSIIEHPSDTSRIENPYKEENLWIEKMRRKSFPVEIKWENWNKAIDKNPYLSYFFIKWDLEIAINDESIQQSVRLIEMIPHKQKVMTFYSDRAAKPDRQHFLVLRDFCKFNEVWKIFTEEMKKLLNEHLFKDFIEQVQFIIWTRINLDEDASLIKLFVPTGVNVDQQFMFPDIMSYNLSNKLDERFLQSLNFVKSDGQNIPNAQEMKIFFSFVIDHLIKWVRCIVGHDSLSASDASIYVDLLGAVTKCATIRAVLWLTVPSKYILQQFMTYPEPKFTSAGSMCEWILNILLRLTNENNLSSRFHSFLTVCEHPLSLQTSENALVLNWKQESVWMNHYVQNQPTKNSIVLGAKSMELLLTDSPYLSLQLLVGIFRKGKKCQECFDLMEKIPKSIIESSFSADVDMCGTESNIHFMARHAMHFMIFVDAQLVTEMWNLLQTDFSFTSPTFINSAQNKLLSMLEKQREAPSGNDNDFSTMALKLGMCISPTQQVQFSNIIPHLVTMKVNAGDKAWKSLLTFLNFSNLNVQPMSPTTALQSKHIVWLKEFIDNMIRWVQKMFCNELLNDSVGEGFAELLSGCLDNITIRALCAIVMPRCTINETSSGDESSKLLLSRVIAAMHRNRNEALILSLLHELGHPGIKKQEDVLFILDEPGWEEEIKWLHSIRSKVCLSFDSTDFTFLENPSYLMFRYLSRDFHNIDGDQNYTTIYQLQRLVPENMDQIFQAQANYLPCRNFHSVIIQPTISAPHFKYMKKYCLYNHMWKIILSNLSNSPNLDASFVHSVVYEIWMKVSNNLNRNLTKVLLPLPGDILSDQTYAFAVQRHAISMINPTLLHILYPGFTKPILVTDDSCDISSHNLLMDRILLWTRALSANKERLEEKDGLVFVELLGAVFSDVAMRAFICTFVPSTDILEQFMNGEESTGCNNGAVSIVKFISDSFLAEGWLEYRSFLDILKFPAIDSGKLTERHPVWSVESKWINSQLKLQSESLSWKEMKYVFTKTPYIMLLLVTKGLPADQRNTAMRAIPGQYLLSRFVAKYLNHSSISSDDAPHFVSMCLNNSTKDFALKVFFERGMICETFFVELLRESCSDSTCPRLLQAFKIVKTLFFENDGKSTVWCVDNLKLVPAISAVLISFLAEIGSRSDFIRDEKIIGNFIMLILQLESCQQDDNVAVANVTSLPSVFMRRDKQLANKFFQMLSSFNFVKWFSRLCQKYNGHYGKELKVSSSPILEYSSLYSEEQNNSASLELLPDYSTEYVEVMLDESLHLTKSTLTMAISGFFNLCVEFNPMYLTEYVSGLGDGRPFFSYFLHPNEPLCEKSLESLCRIMQIEKDNPLYKRIQGRYICYDNDHTITSAIQTIGLSNPSCNSLCINLNDSEFADLLTVAVYLHDVRNLKDRFERIVADLIRDQDRREIVVKFVKWVIQFYIDEDIVFENNPKNSKSNIRVKWNQCEKFSKVSFEDIIECAGEAAVASHLLRSNSRSNSYNTLERLFLFYVRESPPSAWLDIFRGSKTIAYFIKYVDVEDLNLAFDKFFEMNPNNNCFKHHLLQVRKLLTCPIVSSQELINLTSSSKLHDANNSVRFFNQLYKKGKELPRSEADLKIIYLLTASWMKISKEKVLFPLPPRNAQIITLLTVASWAKSLLGKRHDKSMGKTLIAQVGTGEGKSLIIAMMAIYFVKVLKKRVHILENNAGLLEKDVENMKPLFAEFNIKTRSPGTASAAEPDFSHTTVQKLKDKNCRVEFASFGVTYCLRRNLERFYQDSVMAGDYYPMQNTVLIVDEVDDIIVDSDPNQPYSTNDSDQQKFREACLFLKDNNEIPENFASSFVWELAQRAKEEAERMLENNEVERYGSRFILKGYLDSYNTSLEYLNFVHNGIPPVFKSCFYMQSVPYMLSQYDCITGFSGSLGSPAERDFLRQQYKAWWFDTPSFLNTCTNVRKVPPKLMDDDLCKEVPCVHIYDDVQSQVDKIILICSKLYLKVPVVVIAKNTDEAIYIDAKLKESLNREGEKCYVQLFLKYKVKSNELDKENWGHIVRRATAKKKDEDRFCITVTDPFGGRGHDYDVNDDEVNMAGGLAVIMTSIPLSEREWRQWKGRTARKDNNGQYAVVLCSKDAPVSTRPYIVSDYVVKDARGINCPNLFKEEIIDKLLQIQDENTLQILKNLENENKDGRRLNKLCDLYYERYDAMSESTWPATTEEVILRDLLNNPGAITSKRAVDDVFNKLRLVEQESFDHNIEAPVIDSNSFWNDDLEEEWKELAEKYKNTLIPPPPPLPEVNIPESEFVNSTSEEPRRLLGENELFSHRSSKIISPILSATQGVVNNRVNQFEVLNRNNSKKYEKDSSMNLKIELSNEDESHHKSNKAFSRPRRASASTIGTHKLTQSISKSQSFEENEFDYLEPDWNVTTNSSHSVKKKLQKVNNIVNYDSDNFSEPDNNTFIPLQQPSNSSNPSNSNELNNHPIPSLPKSVAKKQEKGANNGNDVSDDYYESDDNVLMPPLPPHDNPSLPKPASKQGKGAKKDQPILPAPVEELNAHDDDLGDEADSFEQILVTANKPKMQSTAKVEEAPFDPTLFTTNKVTQVITTASAPLTGIVASSTFGNRDVLTGIEASVINRSEFQSTSIGAMKLIKNGGKLQKLSQLSTFCIGETVKIKREMNDLLYDAKNGDPLTVGVTETSGSDVGQYVAGLEVTGGLEKTSMSYSLIFQAKVNPESAQFNISLYGMKKFVAKWNNIIVFEQNLVMFKPAVTFRPPPSFTFHNAKTAQRIKASGTIIFSSKDDPRSAVKPVFPERKVTYQHDTPIALPNNLPDGIITVTPNIKGFSKVSNKFVLFEGERGAEQSQVMLSAADLAVNEWRVVLSWNAKPADLDLYCATSFEPKRIYFAKKNIGGSKSAEKGMIELDVDVRNGNGPETITFTPNATKKYRFCVHNYSNEIPIFESGAKIELFRGSDADVMVFQIPRDIIENSRWWHVLDIENNDIAIVNEVVEHDPSYL